MGVSGSHLERNHVGIEAHDDEVVHEALRWLAHPDTRGRANERPRLHTLSLSKHHEEGSTGGALETEMRLRFLPLQKLTSVQLLKRKSFKG